MGDYGNERIFREQIRLLYRKANIGYAASIFNSAIIVFALWNHVPNNHLLIWLFAVICLTTLRIFIAFSFFRIAEGDFDTRLWLDRFVVWLFLIGATWGSSMFVIYPEHSMERQVLLAFVIGGMVAGSVGVFSAVMKAFTVFSIPMVLPVVLRFVSQGDDISIAMGGLSAVFAVLMCLTARQVNLNLLDTMALKFENVELISDLREAKTKAENQSISLAKENEERKTAEANLKNAKERAEEATRLKDRFVSLVAHDLRAPIASVIGFLDLVSGDKETPPSEKHGKIVEIASSNCRNLLTMIGDLLSISRLHTGNIVPEPRFFDGKYLAEGAKQNILGLAEKKEITISNEIPVGTRLYADQTLFGQVIQNLLSNAIKFTHKGGWITLFVPEGETTTLAVRDTGIGINETIIEKIFFHEEKTSMPGTGGETGTGLGLPYSYEIMKSHNGSLTVESKVGEGSVFYARLPFRKPKILLVDNDSMFRAYLKDALDRVGAEFFEVGNGKEGIRRLKYDKPNLILLDISMPVMNGLDFLTYIRNRKETRSIPVIVVSSMADNKSREEAFLHGADDFLAKPIDRSDLQLRVKRFIV